MSIIESASPAEHSVLPARTRAAARIPMSIFTAALLAVSAPLAAGCATNAEEPVTGQLVLPLVQSGPHGELFRLSHATFDIFGNDGSFQSVDGGTAQNAVAVSLAPGVFTVQLEDGWVLEKSLDGGSNFLPVSALLGSPNPSGLRVLANQPVILEYDFLVRNIDGTLMIKLGVVTEPRELAGGILVNDATGGLADYALDANRRLDFAIFFKLASLKSEALADGTKQHIYTAGPSGTPGPLPPDGSAVAAEFYNDQLGILSGQIAADLQAAFLQYTVAAKLDGSFEFSGSVQGFSEIDFGPSAIDAVTAPTLDGDGFPKDEFFYDSGSPFTLTSSLGTMSGVLRVRHLVP